MIGHTRAWKVIDKLAHDGLFRYALGQMGGKKDETDGIYKIKRFSLNLVNLENLKKIKKTILGKSFLF